MCWSVLPMRPGQIGHAKGPRSNKWPPRGQTRQLLRKRDGDGNEDTHPLTAYTSRLVLIILAIFRQICDLVGDE